MTIYTNHCIQFGQLHCPIVLYIHHRETSNRPKYGSQIRCPIEILVLPYSFNYYLVDRWESNPRWQSPRICALFSHCYFAHLYTIHFRLTPITSVHNISSVYKKIIIILTLTAIAISVYVIRPHLRCLLLQGVPLDSP